MTAISINTQWCKCCSICIDLCPNKVLALDENSFPKVVDEGSCNKCKLCELYCSDLAIEIVEENNE